MKKNTVQQKLLIAFLALLIGFLGGYTFTGFSTMGDKDGDYYEIGKFLSGTIGKVDRYRNVKITENDLLLRNELIEDSVKRNQYEKYLLYYYYQSLRTSADVDAVLPKASSVEAFQSTYYPYADAVSKFRTYLESAREDILMALNMIVNLEQDTKLPVVDFLNQAQNAVHRIRNHEQILVNYLEAMSTFISSHPDQNWPELEEAREILSMNLLQSAILTQNKPILVYLHQNNLATNKEQVKESLTEAVQPIGLQNQMANDIERLGLLNGESLQKIIWTDMETLNAISLENIEQLGVIYRSESLGTGFTDSEQLGKIIWLSNEQLNLVN